jgi:uncharacterized protein with GYD domain
MPKYIALFKFTPQGAKEIKQLPERRRNAVAAVERSGGKVLGWYLTEGHYDVVTIVEAPDEHMMAIGLLAIASGGNVQSETLRAFDENEADQIISRLP